MSQENVEIVRKFGLDEHGEWLTYLDPTVVWNSADESARGVEGVEGLMTRWESTWDDYEVIPEDFVDAGDRVSRSCVCVGAVGRAVRLSTPGFIRSSRSMAARSSAWTNSWSAPKPSKPWGCRNSPPGFFSQPPHSPVPCAERQGDAPPPSVRQAGYSASDVAGERSRADAAAGRRRCEAEP